MASNSVKIFLLIAITCCIISNTLGQLLGSISSNPAGGQDVNAALGKKIGSDDHNIGASVFGGGNTKTGETFHGGALNYNLHGHGLSASKVFTPNADITSEAARVNLLNSGAHKLDTNLQHSNIKLNNGFDFDKYRGSLDYNHAAGHAASVGLSSIPKFDSKVLDLSAKANLWTSDNKMTTLDAIATGSRAFGGVLDGQTNFGGGLGLTHKFGAFGK